MANYTYEQTNNFNFDVKLRAENAQLKNALREAEQGARDLENSLESVKYQLGYVQDEFARFRSGSGVDELQSKLEILEETAYKSGLAFKSFIESTNLKAAGRSISDTVNSLDASKIAETLETLQQQVTNGYMSLDEAITRVKTNFSNLFSESVQSSGSVLDPSVYNAISDALTDLGNKLDTVLQKFEAFSGGAAASGADKTAENFRQIGEAAEKMVVSIDSTGDFASQLIERLDGIKNGLTGVGTVARVAFEELSDISKVVKEISLKDFSSNFDFSGAFKESQSEAISKYKVQVKEYVAYVKAAADEVFSYFSKGANGKSLAATAGVSSSGIFTKYSEAADVLSKTWSKLNLNNQNLGTLESRAMSAKDAISALIPYMEQLNQAGVGLANFNIEKLLDIPEKPATAASQVTSAFTGLGEVLAKVSASQEQTAQATSEALSKETEAFTNIDNSTQAHAAAMEAAAEAERQKQEASESLKAALMEELAQLRLVSEAAKLDTSDEWHTRMLSAAEGINAATTALNEYKTASQQAGEAERGLDFNIGEKIASGTEQIASNLSNVSKIEETLISISELLATSFANVGKATRSAGADTAAGVSQTKQAAEAYKELLRIQTEIGNRKVSLAGLDAETDASMVEALSQSITKLQANYDQLFQKNSGALFATQLDRLRIGFEEIEMRVEEVRAKMADMEQGEASANAYNTALTAVINTLRSVETEQSRMRKITGGQDTEYYNSLTELVEQLKGLRDGGGSTSELVSGLKELKLAYADTLEQANLFKIAVRESESAEAAAASNTKAQASAVKQLESLYIRLQKAQTQLSGSHSIMEVQTLIELQEKVREVVAANREGTASVADLETAYREIDAVFSTLKISIAEILQQTKDQAEAEREDAAAIREAEAAEKARIAESNKREASIRKLNTMLVQCTNTENKFSAAQKIPGINSTYTELEKLKQEIQELSTAFQGAEAPTTEMYQKLQELQTRLSGLQTSFKTTGNFFTNYMSNGLSMLASRLSYTFGLVNIVMKSVQKVKELVSIATDLNTAMNQLQIVTHASGEEMDKYAERISAMAYETAQSTKDLIDASTVYARLGYDMDESAILAKYTAMLQGVGDIGASEAQDAMTAIIKAFGMSVNDVEPIMDKLVAVGNNFPISVSQIAEGMNNASSMLAVAGNSFEQSVALLTAANTTIQNVSKASTGLRTIAARIRKTTTGLDDEGEIVEEAKYEEMLQALTKHQVTLTDINGEYRTTYDIIKDIAAVWDDLTSMEQAAVIEALAGTRQQNIFTSLVTQFQEAENAMDKMGESAGELEAAYSIRMSSIQAHVDQLKAAWDKFAVDLVNSDLAIAIVDAITRIVQGLDFLITKLGILGTVVSAIAIVKITKALYGLVTATELTTGAVTGLAGATGALSAAMPYVTLIAIGVAALVAAYKEFKSAYDAANVSLEDLKKDASAAADKVNSLQEELDANNKRIKELQELHDNGVITDAQQAELEGIKEQNKELEEQLELYREIAKYKQGVADTKEEEINRREATKFFNTERTTQDNSRVGYYGSGFGATIESTTGMGGVLNAIDSYRNAAAEYDKATSRWHDALASGEELTNEQRQAYANLIDASKNSLTAEKTKLLEQKATLIEASKQVGLTTGQRAAYAALIGKVTKALGESSSAYDKLGLSSLSEEKIGALSNIESFEQLQSFFNSDHDLKLRLQYSQDSEWERLREFKELTSLEALYFTVDTDALEDEMERLSDGGNVDLKVRPVIDTKELFKAGYTEIEEGVATLYSETMTNAAGTKGALFTPMFLDEKGNTHILGPEEFHTYCEAVMEGAEDDLNLRITGDFEGDFLTAGSEDIKMLDRLGLKLSDLQNIYFRDQIEGLENISTGASRATTSVADLVKKVSTLKEHISTLDSITEEAFSDVGLSLESVADLEEMFKDIESFNPADLFIQTATGIRVNADELDRLTDEYYKLQRADINKTIAELTRESDSLASALANLTDEEIKAGKAQALLEEYSGLQTQIEKAEEARAAIDGMTSAYKRFLKAQDTDNENTAYLDVAGFFDDAKEAFEQGFGYTDDVSTWLDLIYGDRSGKLEDNYNAYQNLFQKIKGTNYSMSDFFTEDSAQGALNFLDAVNKVYGNEYVKKGKDGSYTFDFSGDKLFEVADGFNLSAEAIQILEGALQSAGLDVKFDTMADSAARASYDLKQLGLLDKDFTINDVNVDNVESKIQTISDLLAGMKNENGEIDFSITGANEAYTILSRLVKIRDNLTKVEIPVDVVDEEFTQDILKIQEEIETLSVLNTTITIDTVLGNDTTKLEERRDEILASLSGNEIVAELGIDTSSADTAIAGWEKQVEDGTITKKVTVETGSTAVETTANATIKYDADTSDADSTLADMTKPASKLITVSVGYGNYNQVMREVLATRYKDVYIRTYYSKGTANYTEASGTANAKGTAAARGNWGAKKNDDMAIVGEVGPEIRVRDGHWELLGENSTEIASIRKGDIIFNAEQTRQILKNGKITNGYKRGVSYTGGTAYDAGSGSFHFIPTSSSGSSSSSSSSYSSSTDYDAFDYIEVFIDRFETLIDQLQDVATDTMKNESTRLGAVSRQIDETNQELSLANRMYDRYMQEAASINLDSYTKSLIRTGAIQIGYYDSDTQDLIDQYQEWYEKALDVEADIIEMHRNLGQLYIDSFDYVQTYYEDQLDDIERTATMAEKHLDMARKKGYLESADFYETMANVQADSIRKLNSELQDLNFYFAQAMASHEIDEGSEAWYEMKGAINDVEEAIADANIQLQEYQNTIRELQWGYFDYAQDRLRQVSQEANFLIGVMSNDELFGPNGKFNELGEATAALHAVNYDQYMLQADEYAKEIEKIQRDLASDPYNTDLISRRETLLGLQQQSITSAENEKNAIRSLVESGINLEIEALSDLIDSYEDSLESAKDLYEYQKKITEKTGDIASIQKQLSAYSNDSSEETRAKVQQLQEDLKKAQTDLRETEWDQNINDQKKLLDALKEEYQDFLNKRLDDVDALMQEMIAGANENMESIKTTLTDVGAEVGYTLTNAMQGVLSGDLSYYDYAFEGISSVAVTLDSIYDMVAAIARASGAVKAYATGGLVDYTGLAAVHGSKNSPELMLNAGDTANFLAAAQLLRDAKFGTSATDLSAIRGVGTSAGGVNIGQISLGIQIDHVQDYNDLINQMRDDPKFERLIGAMTLDRAVGKSSFSKNKIIF